VAHEREFATQRDGTGQALPVDRMVVRREQTPGSRCYLPPLSPG
jgi:hypothetical protein